jgi:hypothetical protein
MRKIMTKNILTAANWSNGDYIGNALCNLTLRVLSCLRALQTVRQGKWILMVMAKRTWGAHIQRWQVGLLLMIWA